MNSPVQLASLMDGYQIFNVAELKEWLDAHGVKMQKMKAPTVRGRYRGRRIHWHWMIERADAERLLPERYKELALIPPSPRFYTIQDAAAKMKVSRAKLEAMIQAGEVDVLVDGYWLQQYLQRGKW